MYHTLEQTSLFLVRHTQGMFKLLCLYLMKHLFLFTRFKLNHSFHMDSFYDAFMAFFGSLKLDFKWRNRNLCTWV